MHTLKVTAANVHDVTMTAELLTGEEETVRGDSGYLGAEKREDAVLRKRKSVRFLDSPSISSRPWRDCATFP